MNQAAPEQITPEQNPPNPEGLARLRQTALDLLARREHSQRELEYKLRGRGFEADDIVCIEQELVKQGLLSNHRFAEQYVHSRVQKGFGPLRIQSELRERGLTSEEIEVALASGDAASWDERALAARIKRFGSTPPEDYKERARQMRFLQQRGYSQDQIRSALTAP